jgi:hypothetical protein
MTCTMYCVKIEEIFDAMIHLSYEVLPENQRNVNNYIQSAWDHVAPFARSIEKDEEGTDELRSQFESYVAAEEARLQRNFEAIKYRIDGSDAVRLVSEDRRLETVIEAVLCCRFLHDADTNSYLGPFPNVLSCFEESSRKDQPRSKTCPF